MIRGTAPRAMLLRKARLGRLGLASASVVKIREVEGTQRRAAHRTPTLLPHGPRHRSAGYPQPWYHRGALQPQDKTCAIPCPVPVSAGYCRHASSERACTVRTNTELNDEACLASAKAEGFVFGSRLVSSKSLTSLLGATLSTSCR